jgi:uncharacterized protein (DUF169 family)
LPTADYRNLSAALTDALKLSVPPMAITFSAEAPAGVPAFDAPMPEPTADGRTGRVPAGCVFWMHGPERTFTTAPADHGNCNVGSLTHGLRTLEEAATGADVAALVEAGWVSPEVFPMIPTIKDRPGAITYGPLADTPVEPDVVFLRLNAKQAMLLHDAVPELRFEGKPQCHIVPIAVEQGQVAISVGCMLSRVRTGMPASELTCAIPAAELPRVIEALGTARPADEAVARYAAADKKRFEQT